MIWVLVALSASVLLVPFLARAGPRLVALLPVLPGDSLQVATSRSRKTLRSKRTKAALDAASKVLS